LPPLRTITMIKSAITTSAKSPLKIRISGSGCVVPLSWMMLAEVTPLVRCALLS